MNRERVETQGTTRAMQRVGGAAMALIVGGAALVATLLTAMPALAQVSTLGASTAVITVPNTSAPKVRVIEWDLPAQGDSRPGAVVVDTQGRDKNRLWFVTREAGAPVNPGDEGPHLYRMEFPKSLMKGPAKWTSWKLNALITGGIRRVHGSWDRNSIFIRTISDTFGEAIERVDTDPTRCPGINCKSTVYQDVTTTTLDVSDVAVDDRNNVFTTHTPDANPDLSYVQRLTPGTTSAVVTRWFIPGSGAGLCGGPDVPTDQITENTPCISGIAVPSNNRNLVYFSEPITNSIAELNIAATPKPTVRRWSLATLSGICKPTANVACTPIFGPRQLQIDKRGKIWVVTGSAHLISLDPCADKFTIHKLPDDVLANPFGLAPDDDAIGYTASQTDKVGMMLPKGQSYCVKASTPVCVDKITICNYPADTKPSMCQSNTVCPVGKTVAGQVTPKDDGTFVEAKINTTFDSNGDPTTADPNRSMNPLGITPVKSKAQGTFFYTVGGRMPGLFDRVGFVRLPVRGKINWPRDDDDENDGDDSDHKWHDWHGHANNDDDDDDGVGNKQDHHDARERDARENDTTADDGALAGGSSKDYTIVTTPTSLAIVALTTATDPLAQIEIAIYDALGMFVARSLPTPGLASVEVLLPAPGTYTCRISNRGTTTITHAPKLLVREPWEP